MKISTFKILLIAQLVWLFFKGETLFPNWWFIPIIALWIFGAGFGEYLGDKIMEKYPKTGKNLKGDK